MVSPLDSVLRFAHQHRWTAIGAVVLALGFLTLGVTWRLRERGQWVPATTGPIVEAIYSLGTVRATHSWTLKTGVALGITNVYVQEGDRVRAGQALLVSDSGLFRTPISGTVTKLLVQKGEVLLPGTPALQVMDLRERYIQLSLDQPSALRVRPGQTAEISVESIRGTKLSGTVGRIYPSDSQFLVRVDVRDMPAEILPEMTADVAIEVARREKSLLVPLAAVNRGMLRVRRNGKRLPPLRAKIGAVNGEYAEILDQAVKPGDEVFVPER